MRLVLLRALVVVILAVFSGLAVNSGQIFALLHKVPVQAAEDYAPIPVELPFVRTWQQEGKLLVDARAFDNYSAGHIAGAYSVPIGDQQRLQALVDCCVRRTEVLVYCSSISCSDAFTMGEQLFVSGFKRVYLYDAGFTEWQQQQPWVTGSQRQLDNTVKEGGER
ncbi:MAG: rhodanese-like domain-containing protein [Desulfuromonas sp.]|nr:rhodanese-like domain-containing protein [Desulfuromonas sp.]